MRAHTPGGRIARLATAVAGTLAAILLVLPSVAAAASGGSSLPRMPEMPDFSGGAPATGTQPAPVPGATARLARDGRTAIPPASAPDAVKRAIYAANEITHKPYRYGGGHKSWRSHGYDCSGAVSYALRGGGLLKRPLHSSAFMRWGEPGRGSWITVYTNPGHAYVVIAGLRFDTSGPGERGPRWRASARSSRSYKARHPEGL